MSRNFSSFKTITTGPLRTVFLLNYNDWVGPEGPVKDRHSVEALKGRLGGVAQRNSISVELGSGARDSVKIQVYLLHRQKTQVQREKSIQSVQGRQRIARKRQGEVANLRG